MKISLGMNHDEDEGCGNGNIQSARTGGGKTVWSACSISQMRRYLTSLKRSRSSKIFLNAILL